jgi:hypothetical protein
MEMYSPEEAELLPVLERLRKDHPSLGIPKFHALVLAENPTWTLSEKRVKKILTTLGMGPISSGNPNSEKQRVYPSSKLNQSIAVDKWTCKSSL